MTASLAEMRALCAVCSRGPWYALDVDWGRIVLGEEHSELFQPNDGGNCICSNTDADFIAASREFIPWAIKRIELARALEHDLTKQIRDADDENKKLRKIIRDAQLSGASPLDCGDPCCPWCGGGGSIHTDECPIKSIAEET